MALRRGGEGAGEELRLVAGVGVGEQEPRGFDGVGGVGAGPQGMHLPGPSRGEGTGGEQGEAGLARGPAADEGGRGVGRAVVDHPHEGRGGLCQETVEAGLDVMFFVTYGE